MTRLNGWKNLRQEEDNECPELVGDEGEEESHERQDKQDWYEETEEGNTVKELLARMWNKENTNARANAVNLIQTRDPEGLNTFTQDGLWEEVKYSVDSGATESVTPADMPRSVKAVAVKLPVLPLVSDVSSTFIVSLPASPYTFNDALIPLTLPFTSGALLPTLIVSASSPALIVVFASIVFTFVVSAPAPVFTTVTPATVWMWTVSPPPRVFRTVLFA